MELSKILPGKIEFKSAYYAHVEQSMIDDLEAIYNLIDDNLHTEAMWLLKVFQRSYEKYINLQAPDYVVVKYIEAERVHSMLNKIIK